MGRIFTVVMAVGIALTLGSCSSSEKKSSRATAKWFSNMHRLSAAHLQLMPMVADGRKFANPAARQDIEYNLREMVEAASQIIHDDKAPDADPLIAYSGSRFAIEVRQAYQAFKLNDLQWSRYALNRASGYCISCHTRADRGQADLDMAWTPDLSSLNSAQKVDYLLANRRYFSALQEAKKLAADTSYVQKDPKGWLVALEGVMAMLVRVKKDPKESERLAQSMAKNSNAPNYMRSDAAIWVRDIARWKKEASNRDQLATVIELMRKSEGSSGRGNSGFILQLRASSILHTVLENTRSSKYAEALLYAGMVSQSLADLNMGFLDQYYFESCIRNKPHTDLAERCFVEYERSVHSSNPFLDLEPESNWAMSNRLSDLRLLAQVKDMTQEPVWRRWNWDKDDKSNERSGH